MPQTAPTPTMDEFTVADAANSLQLLEEQEENRATDLQYFADEPERDHKDEENDSL